MSRLLVDENLPPSLAAMLRQAGHDAVHVNQVGLAGTEDPTIMAHAHREGRTVVTLDRDYPHLLRDGAEGPSVIRIDQRGSRAVTGVIRQAEALQAALPKLEAYLAEGASVTLDARGVRVDPLPLGRASHGIDAATADRRPAGDRRAAPDGRAPTAHDISRSARDSTTAGREPSRSGRGSADRGSPDHQPQRADGIGLERRAHPSSPGLGR